MSYASLCRLLLRDLILAFCSGQGRYSHEIHTLADPQYAKAEVTAMIEALQRTDLLYKAHGSVQQSVFITTPTGEYLLKAGMHPGKETEQ